MKVMYHLVYWLGKERFSFSYNTRQECEEKRRRVGAYRWNITILNLTV